jgi:hypothetical protein
MIILIHMIFLNHENHFNHIKITVQTKERMMNTIIISNTETRRPCTDVARNVSTTAERSDHTVFCTDVARRVSTTAGTATTAQIFIPIIPFIFKSPFRQMSNNDEYNNQTEHKNSRSTASLRTQ